MEVAIIGGGAAGFFASIQVKENHPEARVTIFEKSNKLLSKVRVSGGGRCNVTNACKGIKELVGNLPRGGKQLKKAFQEFDNHNIAQWFTSRNVPLVAEDDQRVFPESNSSQTIIDCFLAEINRLSIAIEMKKSVLHIEPDSDRLALSILGNQSPVQFDKVIVATGGSPKRSGLVWLENLGHKIEDPVPSLFTFNMPDEPIRNLAGISVDHVNVHILGTKQRAEGPILITHWGMSGPVILRLSSLAARDLHSIDYNFKIQINWTNQKNHEKIKDLISEQIKKHPKKLLNNSKPLPIPSRLWEYLIIKGEILPGTRWEELNKKNKNKLLNVLCNDEYQVSGKTTFKEEFVTCGGISLESIDMNTMQSKMCKQLYFAGEVMDIDGITGGFNFQAAWTTAYIAGKLQ